MNWCEAVAESVGLDPQRVAQLAAGSVEELVALAQAEPAAFARFFGLADPWTTIAQLEKALPVSTHPVLSLVEEPQYPINGVPFEHWPPASNIPPDDRELANLLRQEIAVLRAEAKGNILSAEIKRYLARRIAPLQTLFATRPRCRRVERYVGAEHGYEIFASTLIPVDANGKDAHQETYEIRSPDGTIIANALESLAVVHQRIDLAITEAAGKPRPRE